MHILNPDFTLAIQGNSIGKFSNFIVVNLTTQETYPLDDVIAGII